MAINWTKIRKEKVLDMKSLLRKNNFVVCGFILLALCLGIVLAADVVVKEGVVEGYKFKSTGCTASGAYAIAFGYDTEATGDVSTAMGGYTTASAALSTAMGYRTDATGYYSTAMGYYTEASGLASTAIGFLTTAGPANWTTTIGKDFINNVQDSFSVGYNDEDLRVTDDLVNVYGDLYVVGDVDADDYLEHSCFYDKSAYGKALDYAKDSSETIKLNANGEKEYNHEADPSFLRVLVTMTDYDRYTEQEVWNEDLQKNITTRNYQTHQELRSNLGMKVAWLRQCVFELKQENQTLKDEIAKLKTAVGID